MNNPQKELGHLKIATGNPENDILTALISAGLSGAQYQIVLFILRKTWGYEGKKEDWIALEQFVEVTGRTERGVLNAIFDLAGRKIIIREKKGRRVYYSFNKRFHGWSILNSTSVNNNSVKKSSVNKTSLNSRSEKTEVLCISRLNKSSDTKENLTKENIQKTRRATPDDVRLAKLIAIGLMKTNIIFAQKFSPNSEELKNKVFAWAEDIEKLRRIDNVTSDQIEVLLQWLYESSEKNAIFWRKNIQSGATLREKFMKLVPAMEEDAKKDYGKKAAFIS